MIIFEKLHVEAKICWGPKSAIIIMGWLRVTGEDPTDKMLFFVKTRPNPIF